MQAERCLRARRTAGALPPPETGQARGIAGRQADVQLQKTERVSMHSTRTRASSPVAHGRSRLGKLALRTLLPALAAGAGLWLAPSDAAAAPRCSSNPAVCARIANERKARPQPAPVARTQPAPAAVAR